MPPLVVSECQYVGFRLSYLELWEWATSGSANQSEPSTYTINDVGLVIYRYSLLGETGTGYINSYHTEKWQNNWPLCFLVTVRLLYIWELLSVSTMLLVVLLKIFQTYFARDKNTDLKPYLLNLYWIKVGNILPVSSEKKSSHYFRWLFQMLENICNRQKLHQYLAIVIV